MQPLTAERWQELPWTLLSTEPIQMDNPLIGAKNVIITPHISWAPKESRQRLMDIAVDNLKCYVDGKPQNVVNA